MIRKYIKQYFAFLNKNRKSRISTIAIIILILFISSFGISKIIAKLNVKRYNYDSIITNSNYTIPLSIKNDPFDDGVYNNVHERLYKQLNGDMRNEFLYSTFSNPISFNKQTILKAPFDTNASCYYQSDFYRNDDSNDVSDHYIININNNKKYYHINNKCAFNSSDDIDMGDHKIAYITKLRDDQLRKEYGPDDDHDFTEGDYNVADDHGLTHIQYENPDTTEQATTDFAYQTLNSYIAPESYDNMQSHVYSKYYVNGPIKYNYDWKTGRWRYQLNHQNTNKILQQNKNNLEPFLKYWLNSNAINTKLYNSIDAHATNKQINFEIKPVKASFLVGQQNNVVLPSNLPVPKYYKNTSVNVYFIMMLNPQKTKIEQIGFNFITKRHMYRTGLMFNNAHYANWSKAPLYVKASCYGNLICFGKDHYKKLSHKQIYNEYYKQMKKQTKKSFKQEDNSINGFWTQLKRKIVMAYDSLRYGIQW